ncbi:uncharacterized protein LOC120187725 [Hibiscus syriacus]|uniref:uncharacterized protein LOC120187725 n=1 Tax=Hibiscus syriacus TaxID=106335 RepID=UPI001924B81D|nr:uncharacterized protein LOC120187725 [Hibiscus syriacus]
MGSLNDEITTPLIDTSDLPIAQRKGFRNCTHHLIQKYMAYGRLMMTFKAFTSKVDTLSIPKSIDNALKDPRWKNIIEEKIKALEVCKLIISLYGLKQSPCAWFERLKDFLAKEFETKDLGSLRYFLSMEVSRTSSGFLINQRKYVLDLLSKIGIMGCKPA